MEVSTIFCGDSGVAEELGVVVDEEERTDRSRFRPCCRRRDKGAADEGIMARKEDSASGAKEETADADRRMSTQT